MGYFEESLKSIQADSVVLVFEDADLPSSVKSCLQHLWPKLQEGCKFYSHEAFSVDVVALFYDRKWWRETFDVAPPGFFGSGHGLQSGFVYSACGYAMKCDVRTIIETGRRIVHRGLKDV